MLVLFTVPLTLNLTLNLTPNLTLNLTRSEADEAAFPHLTAAPSHTETAKPVCSAAAPQITSISLR